MYAALAFEESHGEEPSTVRDPENYFYLVVKGDSMAPDIKEGDLALVRRQNTLSDGQLGCVIYNDNQGVLRQFWRDGDGVMLQPLNPDYEKVHLSGEDMERLYIAGRVVETKRRW